MTGRVTLKVLAAEAGLTEQQARAEIDQAVAAGFLSIVSDDGQTVTYEATFPVDIQEAS